MKKLVALCALAAAVAAPAMASDATLNQSATAKVEVHIQPQAEVKVYDKDLHQLLADDVTVLNVVNFGDNGASANAATLNFRYAANVATNMTFSTDGNIPNDTDLYVLFQPTNLVWSTQAAAGAAKIASVRRNESGVLSGDPINNLYSLSSLSAGRFDAPGHTIPVQLQMIMGAQAGPVVPQTSNFNLICTITQP